MIIFNFIFVTLRFSLGFSLAGYSVYTARLNFVMDVLGGYLKDVKKSIKCLIGDRRDLVLKQMHKAMLSCTLKIAGTLKLFTEQFQRKGRD